MNGEVKSYRLNSPMSWAEFKSMPDDLKVVYIQALRKKYKVPDVNIAGMLGIGRQAFIKEVNRLGVSKGKATGGRRKWDKDGFFAWVNGVDVPTPVTEEEPAEAPVIEEAPVEDPIQEPVIISDEPEIYVEDDLPFDIVPVQEPDPIYPELPELHIALCAEVDELKKRVDELLKVNEELMAVREKDKAHIAWLEVRVDELGTERLMLEKQMDVVRLIFGGKNNG